MTMPKSSTGLIAALMSGGPLPLPSLPCAVCLACHGEAINNQGSLVPAIRTAATLAAGWLVCDIHAQTMAHQLANELWETGCGPDPIDTMSGRRNELGRSFRVPPADFT